jgi:NAD(P)H-dependent flavin oxidoreductase YrpB (nitropropane dioxygenase family)
VHSGQLPELIDVIIDEKAALFVCAVGVPPKEVVDKLHAAKIPVMNMVGHPKHVCLWTFDWVHIADEGI